MFCWMEEELGEALGSVRGGGGEAGAQGRLDGAEEGEKWWGQGVCGWLDEAVGRWGGGFGFDGEF